MAVTIAPLAIDAVRANNLTHIAISPVALLGVALRLVSAGLLDEPLLPFGNTNRHLRLLRSTCKLSWFYLSCSFHGRMNSWPVV